MRRDLRARQRETAPPERGAVAKRLRGFTSTRAYFMCVRGCETPQARWASSPFRRSSLPWFAFLLCGVILSECQKRGRENRADGDGTGRGRKRAILAAWREGRMIRISRFRFRPVAAGEGLCGQPAGRVSRAGDCRTKSQPDFVRMKAPTRRKRRPEAPVFRAFQPPENFFAAGIFRLCGKTQISFSKEISFGACEGGRSAGEMQYMSISRAFFRPVF